MSNFTYPYRDAERDGLQKQLWLSENVSSRMSIVCGRHSMGKTALVLDALRGVPTVYIPLGGRQTVHAIEEYKAACAEALGVFVPHSITTLEDLFTFLCNLAWDRHFSVVLDNFQEASARHPEFYAFLMKKWKQEAKKTKMNLVLVSEEPLQTAGDATFAVEPLRISRLRELQEEGAAGAALLPEDYLAFYLFTAGRPDLVKCCLSRKAVTKKALIELMLEEDSPLAHRAEASVYGLLGKNSDTYLSILQLVATGVHSQAELEQRLGGIIIGGHLAKLENEYKILRRSRPLLSSPDSRGVVRYGFADTALALWFRIVFASDATSGLLPPEARFAKADAAYTSFLKDDLRDYFIDKFTQEGVFTSVGADWAAIARISRKAGRQAADDDAAPREDGVDIVALKGKKAMVASVQLRQEDFRKEPFLRHVDALKAGPLRGYTLDPRLFTLADI